MPANNRVPLGAREDARLATLNLKILAALETGPRTNAELSEIALDYGRRIRDLRFDGKRIDRERIEGGLNQYTLRTDPEPVWLVNVEVTLADGKQSIQTVTVRGTNEGLVRNRAQHLATRVKVLESRMMV